MHRVHVPIIAPDVHGAIPPNRGGGLDVIPRLVRPQHGAITRMDMANVDGTGHPGKASSRKRTSPKAPQDAQLPNRPGEAAEVWGVTDGPASGRDRDRGWAAGAGDLGLWKEL